MWVGGGGVGVVPCLIDGDLPVVKYDDDTILFMKHDLEWSRNMKLLLCTLEQLSVC